MLHAVQTYPVDDNFDPSAIKFEGNLSLLRYYQEEPEFVDHWIILTDNSLRVYQDRDSSIETPEQPLMQIPLSSFEFVIEDFDHDTLNLDYDDQNTTEFLQQRFALKFRNDFLYLYVQQTYQSLGISAEEINEILAGKRALD